MPGLFVQILILLAVSVLVVALFRRFNLPTILGYLFVGMAVGPHGLGLIPDTEDVRLIAGFGVVFLLFTIGLEFSLPKILAMRNRLLGMGSAQVLFTTAVVALIAWLAGMPAAAAFVVGAVLAQSSSTIIGKQLTEQIEINSRHGRLGLGISVFQDVTAVLFVIIIPVLATGAGDALFGPLALALIKGAAVFAVMLVLGRWLLRPLFHEVAAARSAELSTLAVLLVVLTAAWITDMAGLSLALGAFLAGMMLGETEYRHQLEADIRPFQDVLLGMFFVTVGMLLDVRALPGIWGWVLGLALATLLLKTLLITAMVRASGDELTVSVRTGLVLAVGGEFGFVLLALALEGDLLSPEHTQIVLTTVLVTMMLSPLLIRYNGAIARRLCAASYGAGLERLAKEVEHEVHTLDRHVIICGYGRVGQNIGRFLDQEGFNFIALDLDPARVREAREAGDPVIYGDSTQRAILEAAGLGQARALIVSFNDLAASFKILAQVRHLHPELPVLVRTRDDAELEHLQAAGATEVVPETLEASLMLSSHLLLILGVPMSRVFRRIRETHNDRYRLLRGFFPGEERAGAQAAPAREQLHTVTLSGRDHAVERTLRELQLDKLGVMVTAVRRRGIRGVAPTPDMRLQEGDVLVLYGAPRALERAEVALMRG